MCGPAKGQFYVYLAHMVITRLIQTTGTARLCDLVTSLKGPLLSNTHLPQSFHKDLFPSLSTPSKPQEAGCLRR